MLLVGLTGGIGSGKSEVSRRLAELGAVIVDADKIAREVVAVGTPGLAEVVATFGAGVLADDGSLDRDALAARVFGDDDARRSLNAIVHPLVGERTLALIAAAGEADPHAVVVNDVPLLVEAGLVDRYDVVLVVAASVETQLRRLVGQRGMTEADARARIEAQAPLADKIAIADIVIDNDGDLVELDAQVRQVWADLADRAGRTMRP
ncbi:MAG: dephospho-CoA kinase [Actinomycetes bacterium]